MTIEEDRELDLQVADSPLEPDEEFEADSGDLPQAVTESYGTGVHEAPGFEGGGQTLHERLRDFNPASVVLTGGDVDTSFEEAEAVGDEAVGGTASTPDMNEVDGLGAAVGLEMDDRAFLRTSEILEGRDDRRWELEPKSSEDYDDRRKPNQRTSQELD